jgi:hypothetical protein
VVDGSECVTPVAMSLIQRDAMSARRQLNPIWFDDKQNRREQFGPAIPSVWDHHNARASNSALSFRSSELTYSRLKGAFAGLTLEGAVVQQDDDSTRAIYRKNMKFRNILSGKVSTPKSADAFMKAVADAGQQARIAEAQDKK